ncbi:MAG TPA: efflux RND transporter periplasmic adaptor subunit [Vicinamibacterales bacterium]|nr:efflux RND transporter periplasmic adaptor subunit [Vicinamibacterales bacterium]
MKKLVIAVVVIVVASAGFAYYTGVFDDDPAVQAAGQGGDTGGRRGGGAGGAAGRFGGQGGARAPMSVEIGQATRASMSEQITVVGNLIADATVSVAPRAAGRLQEISVKLGDRVNRNQRIAKIEDYELIEQVKQAEAAQEVASATIRQREADLKLAQTNAERSRNLFQKQILPKQTLDDNEARLQAAVAQLDLARAQEIQSKARLDELRITLSNTVITSPVNGFVAKRLVDPGAWVSQNAPIVDVVDITRVRLVANIVEKDLKALQAGNPTEAQVDAFPGETFRGRIARVSPVLDPTTRTAPIEIEIPNGDYRLRPGMYARVGINTGAKKNALVVPSNAVVDLGGRRGVFIPQNDVAIFRIVQVGLEQPTIVEVLGGLTENERVITTGASALRDGDRIVLPGQNDGSWREGGGGEAAAAQRWGDGRRGGSAGAGRGATSP